MVGELITLPLRLTGAAARLWWRAADQALGLASGAAGQIIERVSPSSAAPSEPSIGPGPTVRPPAISEPRSQTPIEEPTHVSEEPELVAEFAETGAEAGAGAEVHIREPWEGYRDMTADEIAARLADASAAELGAVELYERSNRGRQTILTAVARQLRSQPPSGTTQLTGANGGDTQR